MTLPTRIYSPSGAAYRHQSGVFGRPRYANLWIIEPGNRVLWYKRLPNPPLSIVADPSGNVIVGYSTGSAPRLTKYDPDGVELWTATPSSSGTLPNITAYSTDASGNIYAATQGSGSNADSAVYKFAPDGTETWRTRLSVGMSEYGVAKAWYDATLNQVIAAVGASATTTSTLFRISTAGVVQGSFGIFLGDSGSLTTSADVIRATGGVAYTWERKSPGSGGNIDKLTAWSSPFSAADWEVTLTITPGESRVAVTGGYVFTYDSNSPQTTLRYDAATGALDGTFLGGGARGGHETAGKLLVAGSYLSKTVARVSVLGVPDWSWGPTNGITAVADVGSGRVAVAAGETQNWPFEA